MLLFLLSLLTSLFILGSVWGFVFALLSENKKGTSRIPQEVNFSLQNIY